MEKLEQHLSMVQLDSLGFETIKSYEHDEYMTQRRQKGIIQIETTWLKTGEFVSQDMTIEEVNAISFTRLQLYCLDQILNQ